MTARDRLNKSVQLPHKLTAAAAAAQGLDAAHAHLTDITLDKQLHGDKRV